MEYVVGTARAANAISRGISSMRTLTFLLAAALFGAATLPVHAVRPMERLGRGVVSVRTDSGPVWVSWRLLGTDAANTAFNVYRVTKGTDPLKLTQQPISAGTFFLDDAAPADQATEYFVRPVVG